jgi:hypothetical protein
MGPSSSYSITCYTMPRSRSCRLSSACHAFVVACPHLSATWPVKVNWLHVCQRSRPWDVLNCADAHLFIFFNKENVSTVCSTCLLIPAGPAAGPLDDRQPLGPPPFLQQLPDRALPWRALCMPDSPALMPSAAALHASQTGLLPTQACS